LNLAQTEAPAFSLQLEQALWDAKNNAFHTCIWTSVGPNQQAILLLLTTI
jgi:hypothetical protein